MKTLQQFISEKAPASKPVFVLVMGGAGVGKNHFISTHPEYKNYKLIDVDAIKKTGVKEYVNEMKKQLHAAFAKKENVIHPTIGGAISGNVNKLIAAKAAGYETHVVFLKGTPEAAKARIQHRVSQGGHGVPDEKIDLTYARSEAAFPEISKHADYHEIKIIH